MSGLTVVDASLALKWVLVERYSREARMLRGEWIRDGTVIAAPPLFAYEVGNAIHRQRIAGTVPAARVDITIDFLLQTVVFQPFIPAMARRGVAIAAETGRPAAYDAQYIALAEALGCELWTADERLWNAVRARFPFVRWIGAR
jgi:predicted nucleic acid-binding protein